MSQPINFELLLNQLFGRFENTFEDQNDHQDREQERISPPHVQFDSFLEEGVLLTPLEWSDSDFRVDEESYDLGESDDSSDMSSVISINSSSGSNSSLVANVGYYGDDNWFQFNRSDVSDSIFQDYYNYYYSEIRLESPISIVSVASSLSMLLPPSSAVVPLRRSQRLKELRLRQIPLRRSTRLAALRARAAVNFRQNSCGNGRQWR